MTDATNSQEADFEMKLIELRTEIYRLKLKLTAGEKDYLEEIAKRDLEIKVLKRANEILELANETQKKRINECWELIQKHEKASL